MAARTRANTHSNIPDGSGDCLHDDIRRQRGVPPARLTVSALASGSMSSNQSGEGEIRKAIIEADLVDCMVALPGQLFEKFGKD